MIPLAGDLYYYLAQRFEVEIPVAVLQKGDFILEPPALHSLPYPLPTLESLEVLLTTSPQQQREELLKALELRPWQSQPTLDSYKVRG